MIDIQEKDLCTDGTILLFSKPKLFFIIEWILSKIHAVINFVELGKYCTFPRTILFFLCTLIFSIKYLKSENVYENLIFKI